ncbi:helix-turn-helix transcriptional regulator [Pseudoalteromonas sp. BDTF-M6]|uniref:helix-turn-helix domain-containing protein n=1 Tax=Pseudoalteromonas sp. BDTF-M6 TaxID=2796132 RepID=UPI001BB07BC8|nr:helix-turn-helix transcriptional regulator [Pseudoalteromonas sp. BDTF-M6]MBS3797091.1 helix-turn-helix transcriptional regulator [Pseudoalteromonas sp. BDTF-M6]
MELAEQLITLRKQQNWTQAFAAREIGIQQSYLSKLENNKVLPSNEVLAKLAQAYNVSAADLLPRAQPQSPQGSHRLPLCWILSVAGLLVLATVLWALAYFELLYAQTHYTYQFVSTDNAHSLSGYHLTQTYLGEAAISADGSTQYRFYGERDISREENRWLFAISILLLITALIVTAVGALKKPTRIRS